MSNIETATTVSQSVNGSALRADLTRFNDAAARTWLGLTGGRVEWQQVAETCITDDGQRETMVVTASNVTEAILAIATEVNRYAESGLTITLSDNGGGHITARVLVEYNTGIKWFYSAVGIEEDMNDAADYAAAETDDER